LTHLAGMTSNAFASPPRAGIATLARDAAFVVQLTSTSRPASGGCRGRVEHIASGSWVYFESLHELLAFVDRALAESGAGD
jgi:hypothetical protein